MCTFVDLLKTSQYFLFMTALNRFSFFFLKREIKKKKRLEIWMRPKVCIQQKCFVIKFILKLEYEIKLPEPEKEH